MTLPATDTFTGTNGTNLTTYSASWSYTAYASNKFAINSNAIYSIFSSDGVFAYWNADAFANAQYSQVKLVAVASGVYLGPAVRLSNSADTGYYLEGDSGDGSYLYKRVAGTETQLGSVGGVAAANQVWRLEANGSTITPKKDGATTGTPGAQTDSAIASGYAGICCWGSSTSARIDDWEGGNLSTGGSGALSGTLDALTASSAGTLPLVGVATPTLAAASVSAMASLTIAGQIASELAPAALAGAGALAIAGALAQELAASTLAGTGILPLVGAATPSLEAATLAALATLTNIGALTGELEAATLSGAGILVTGGVGALDSTLAATTIDAAANLAIAGALTQALADVSQSSAGALALAGVLAGALDPVSLAAAGALAVGPAGELLVALDPATLTAAGALALTGQAASALATLTLSGAGGLAVAGVAAATLTAATLTATGALDLVLAVIVGAITSSRATGSVAGVRTGGSI